MKTKQHLIAIIVLCLIIISPSLLPAQGTILFLSGKEKRFSKAEIKGEYIHYSPEGEDDDFIKRADRYNVFSLIRDNGIEEIIYTPDTSDSEDPTIEEVREYIRGEQLALDVYRKPMNMIGGIAVGLAGSAAGFYGVPVPLVYSTILGQFDPRVPPAPDGKIYSDSFQAGYQRKARNMKIKNSLIGGVIGFGVGITALVVIFSND